MGFDYHAYDGAGFLSAPFCIMENNMHTKSGDLLPRGMDQWKSKN